MGVEVVASVLWLGAVLLVVVGVVGLYVSRQRTLSQRVASFACQLNSGEQVSRMWQPGVAQFTRDRLLWWRTLSFSPRPARAWSRSVLVLEGREKFDAEYAVGGPINPKTGQPFGSGTKVFAEWAAECGKQVLTDAQAELVERMAEGVRQQQIAVDLLSSGMAEGVVRAVYCGLPCQIRMDWFDPHRGIVDLKTCDDLTWFEADARRYGYHRQVAFYRAVLAQVLGGALVPVHLIAVEKKEPFRCGVWRIGDDTLVQAQRENEAAIRRLLVCRENDEWPTGYEDIRILDVL